MNTDPIWMLLLFVAINFAAAGLGARIGDRSHGAEVWYASLRQPAAAPPDWSFAPLWTLVAISTGIAGWRIWQAWLAGGAATALILYGFQLMINAAWQGVTLGLRRLGQGFAIGLLLWVTITLTLLAAAQTVGAAAYWLLPYWLWVGLGVRINRQLWRLNRQPAAPRPPPVRADPPPPGP